MNDEPRLQHFYNHGTFYINETMVSWETFKQVNQLKQEIAELKEQLNNSNNFHCPHYLTNDSGTVSCHHDMKAQLASAIDSFNIILMLDISGKDNQGKIASLARKFLAIIKESE